MNKIRLRYTKTGGSKYISHLDLIATLQRSFLRAGINMKYSEGFNPHPYISAALPLSVGLESSCELMDVGLTDSVLPDITKIKTPEGLNIIETYIPNRKFNEISWIEIIARLYYDKPIDKDLISKLKNDLTRESIIITKRTKRGNKELDIAPYLKDVQLVNDENIILKAKVSAQNPTINAEDIENVIGSTLMPDFFELKRIEIYDSDMVIFR